MPADDFVEVRARPGGLALRLRVKPGARRERLVGPHGGSLKLEVKAPPDRGKANAAVMRLLAEALSVPTSAVEIVSGMLSRDKVAVIEGLSIDLCLKRLRSAGVAAESRP